MRAEIATYKNTLVGLDDTLETKDAALAQRDQERQQLAAQIRTLEQQAADLTTRQKKREVAYAELQERLSDHLETADELKVELATRKQENDRVLTELERRVAERTEQLKVLSEQKRMLEQSLEERDEELQRALLAVEEETSVAARLTKDLRTAIANNEELRRELESNKQRLTDLADQHIAAVRGIEHELVTQQSLVASL